MQRGQMLPFLAAAEILASAPACQELHPPETTTAAGQGYALAEGVRLVLGRDASLDTESDYGQRAMLYTSERGVVQRTYYSSGAQDSSAMTPTFFGHCGPHELLILADVGNEYSWGFRVFAYDGKKLRDLGEIPIAVKGDPDMESAIPFVKLTPHDAVIDLTFTANVIKHPGSQFPQPLAARDVRYQIGATSIRAK
jgi:hypothetical protein